mmetsp:Transcript_27760/g.50607  ORF Transcript_27760/g.50607 Transcript_27760/m.50607 type:complete len:89 (-) Transcript_27760:43-309(-)
MIETASAAAMNHTMLSWRKLIRKKNIRDPTAFNNSPGNHFILSGLGSDELHWLDPHVQDSFKVVCFCLEADIIPFMKFHALHLKNKIG